MVFTDFKKFMRIAFMLLVIPMMAACTDEPEMEEPAVDDTAENADDDLTDPALLTEDLENARVRGTLFFASSADETESGNTLRENLVGRFGSRDFWAGSELQKGDYLLIGGNEMQNVNAAMLGRSLKNGCAVILDKVDSFESLQSFCNNYGIYCPLTEAPAQLHDCVFILAESDVNLASPGNGKVQGLFFMLSPRDNDGNALSDYSQCVSVDMAVKQLNSLHKSMPAKSVCSVSDGTSELTELVGAHKVYLNVNQTLSSGDYRKSSRASGTQTNVYSVEYDIYNVYSLTERRNYYYIHQEFTGSFRPCYKGVYSCNVTTDGCHTIAKVSEWYADEVRMKITPLSTDGMIIHRNSPATTVGSTSYTSGFSWNLGGTVGYTGGKPHIVATGGITCNNSESYAKEDVTVRNNCVPGQALEWSFDFARARASFSLFSTASTKMKEGASAGRNTFNGGTDFIISFPENGRQPSLKGELSVTLRSSAGKCGCICGERTKTTDPGSSSKVINLPYFTHSDFN